MNSVRIVLWLTLLCMPPCATAEARLLVVSGIGGEADYSQQFRTWSLAMLDAARDRLGLPAGNVTWLCEHPDRDPTRCAGPATRDAVLAALAAMAPSAGEPVMLLLIGHGTARDDRALFNLPGPDLSAEDLARALEPLADWPVAVVNTSPASAPFAAALGRRGHVVITATARAAENDHTRFAGHFVAAYAGSAADADKDGRVSLLEAFHFAARQVRSEYAGKKQIATEHAMLDDNGDGRASRDPGADAADGALAATFHLAAIARHAVDSPRRRELERQAQAFLEQLALLRQRRVAMKVHIYQNNLEALLVGLALNQRALRTEQP